jgi:hypothetical protein
MSTSLPGGQFKSVNRDAGEIRLTIHVPPGSKFIDVNQIAGLHNRMPNFSHEKEALFAPGSTFRVDSVASNGDMTLTYVPKKGS